MRLKVLGSSSSGNCYLIENETECLVIEAGLPFMEVKKALDFNIKKIVGVICSHIHGDHFSHMKEYEKAGITSVCFGKSIPEWNDEQFKHYSLRMGKFIIKPFPLVHDVPNYGFFISHPDIGKLVYITDTEYVKYRFSGLNHMIVEANYSKDAIDLDLPNADHVLQGHFSLENAIDFIKANDNAALRNVILCHLSEKNANEDVFLERTKEITNKDVYIAKSGLEVDLSLCPFM